MNIIKEGIVNDKKIELRDRPFLNADYEVVEVGAVMDTVLFSSSSVVSASDFFNDLFKGEK